MGSVAASLVGMSCATVGTRSPASRRLPSIVFILADDMGVGDIQALCPDCRVPTPYLDRVVHEGVTFTDAHSGSAVCSPSRYGLLTGRYCWRTRLREWVLDAYEPPLIAPDRLTLPGLLKRHGYTTACIGKWHLGWDWTGEGEGRNKKADFTVPIRSGPTTRGFDYYFGTDVPNFPPFTFIENDRLVTPPTATYTDDPLLHMGFKTGPMAPGWRFDQILPTLTERAVQFIHQQARTGTPFFLYFPMTSPHEPIAPSERFKGKSSIAPIADFLMETDWSAGQLVEALDRAGIANDTLLIFATDNGHSHYTGWEKLVEHGHPPSGPFRGHKGDIWEGGHRVPFIVRWPGVAAPGTRSDQLICLNDMLATCAALVGDPLPDNAGEDSVNILPAFTGSTTRPLRETLISHDVRGRFAIRHGSLKLVIFAEKEAEPKLELYDLEKDIAETQDLSGRYPDDVQRLIKLLDQHVAKGRSIPGTPQPNDTPDIDIRHLPKQRWARAGATKV
ncbi:MAG: arylsulfatase [Candidatus Hydrogenedentes bacterium]|nr:arylsulfatase [Candidatus Hydrogenedentota bacterium]